jgi:hypothetical protein
VRGVPQLRSARMRQVRCSKEITRLIDS